MSTVEMQNTTQGPASIGEIITKLREPFPASEIDWKIQTTGNYNGEDKGMAVAYVDSRAIQKRLDEAVGPFGWSNTYQPWQEKAQICRLSLYFPERGEWVTKSDGAENSDYEPVKGGLSDAFKRVASLWGIGRYLYELDGIWVKIEKKGKSWAIIKDQYDYLNAVYEKAVARIFGAGAAKNAAKSQIKPETQQPQSNPAPHLPAQQPTQQQNQPAQPPQQNQSNQPPANPGVEGDYTVQSVKPSGKGSVLLELTAHNGNMVKAYARSGNNNIQAGMRLRNVSIIQKNGSYGLYNQVSAYDIAA